MPIDWTRLLTVDASEAAQLFVSHPVATAPKIRFRGFTLRFCGTQQGTVPLIDCLSRLLLKYVFPETERPADIEWRKARNKFGNNDPSRDGKAGEMLLYLFVEAFLRSPLMAYKLKDLGNSNDQVKGADGVFVGEYEGQPALLIGESKIHKDLDSAVGSTLGSLHRFHEGTAALTNELMIARKYPKERGLTQEELDAACQLMSTDSDRVLVHPVFICHDCVDIAEVAGMAKSQAEAEAALAPKMQTLAASWQAQVEGLRTKFSRPFQVFLDFFFLPVEDCLRLRQDFYEMLHGHPYESTIVRAAIDRPRRIAKVAPKKKRPTKKAGGKV